MSKKKRLKGDQYITSGYIDYAKNSMSCTDNLMRLNISNDPVNHPSHYTIGTIEVIDFIEDYGLDSSMQLGNAIKYICRAGHKDPSKEAEDLNKAIWYINRVISKLDKQDHGMAYIVKPNRKYEVWDFVKDKGLDGRWNLAMALFFICYCMLLEGSPKRWLGLAVTSIEEEIEKLK